jgi:L-asparaginase
MRPATALSADGPMNLFNAIAIAGSTKARARGVLVTMNDQIHSAREAEKTNTLRVDTFQSLNGAAAGRVDTGMVDFFAPPHNNGVAKFDVSSLEALPRVDILYAHANMGRELVDAAVAAGARGIVVAGVGDGNMTTTALDALAEKAKQGIAVVRSTRLAYGPVLRNAEVDDDTLGFVASGDLTAAKARVLLQLALLSTSDPAAIQAIFDSH